MLKPAAGRAIRNALIRRRDVPLPEERHDLIVKSVGAARLEGDTGIGNLFDRRLDGALPPVFDITLALPSGFGAAGAIWGLEIAAHFPSFASGAAFGTTGDSNHVG